MKDAARLGPFLPPREIPRARELSLAKVRFRNSLKTARTSPVGARHRVRNESILGRRRW